MEYSEWPEWVKSISGGIKSNRGVTEVLNGEGLFKQVLTEIHICIGRRNRGVEYSW